MKRKRPTIQTVPMMEYGGYIFRRAPNEASATKTHFMRRRHCGTNR
ncbi:hypothetical protein [Caproiciproducens sp. NJN-50]|nr:hypothetical protein [Caproiciproducens sp. NJN-50]